MSKGRDLGVLGVKNFSVGICDGAPSTARSSYTDLFMVYIFVYSFRFDLNDHCLMIKTEILSYMTW